MAEEKKSDDSWMQKQWRPAMGWMYMLVCFCDMVLFPVLWSILQAVMHQPVTQWNPLTLQGAGLFHLAMGAVLGIAAFGRTQEKIAGAAANAPSTPPVAPMPAPAFGSAPTPAFSAPAPKPMGMGMGLGAPAPQLDPTDPPARNTRND